MKEKALLHAINKLKLILGGNDIMNTIANFTPTGESVRVTRAYRNFYRVVFEGLSEKVPAGIYYVPAIHITGAPRLRGRGRSFFMTSRNYRNTKGVYIPGLSDPKTHPGLSDSKTHFWANLKARFWKKTKEDALCLVRAYARKMVVTGGRKVGVRDLMVMVKAG